MMTTEPDTLTLEALAPLPVGPPKNLVANAGFEIDRDKDGLPDSWVIPGGIGSLDDEKKLGIGHSLRLTNTDPEVSAAVYQTLPCLPNRQYSFGVWVAGESVSGPDGGVGASVAVEFIAQDGTLPSGEYPVGPRGSFGWTPINGKFAVPGWAASVRLKLYLGEGYTGKAWFDEVSVAGVLQIFIKQPAYRRTFVASAGGPWVAEIDRSRMLGWMTRKADLRSRVFDAAGEEVMKANLRFMDGKAVAELSLTPPPGLPAGDYRWRFALWNAYGNKLLDEAEYGVRVGAAEVNRNVYVAGGGHTVVNGERFFPLGFYVSAAVGDDPLDEYLTHLSAANFNTVLSYTYGAYAYSEAGFADHPKSYLKAAKAHGLRVLYNLMDFYESVPGFDRAFPGTTRSGLELAESYVNALLEHDAVAGQEALLGWYLTDEPPLSQAQKILDLYQLVAGLDPDHPCFQVHLLDPTNRPSHVLQLNPFYDSTEVMGVDPYPVPKFQPLTMVSEWTEDARAAVRGVKPVWTVVGIADGSNYFGNPCTVPDPKEFCYREPSLAEKRCAAYLALIAGAQGLLFYSYNDIFKTTYGEDTPEHKQTVERRLSEVTQLGKEFDAVTRMLLKAAPLLDMGPTKATSLRWRPLKVAGLPRLLVANPSYKEPVTVNFRLPPPQSLWVSAASNHPKLEVKLRTFGRTRVLEVKAPPAGSGLVTLRGR